MGLRDCPLWHHQKPVGELRRLGVHIWITWSGQSIFSLIRGLDWQGTYTLFTEIICKDIFWTTTTEHPSDNTLHALCLLHHTYSLCLESYRGWTQTHSKKWRWWTKSAPNDARLSRGRTQIHVQAVGQRWQLSITIDVRIHNKARRLSLLQSVLLKGELRSSPPSCCSLSSLGSGETVMINALSAGISDEEPGVPAQVLFAHWWFTCTIFTEWSKSGE